jgi:hypothetical protein
MPAREFRMYGARALSKADYIIRFSTEEEALARVRRPFNLGAEEMKRKKSKATQRQKSKARSSIAAVRKVISQWQRAEARLYARLVKMIDDVDRAAKALER